MSPEQASSLWSLPHKQVIIPIFNSTIRKPAPLVQTTDSPNDHASRSAVCPVNTSGLPIGWRAPRSSRGSQEILPTRFQQAQHLEGRECLPKYVVDDLRLEFRPYHRIYKQKVVVVTPASHEYMAALSEEAEGVIRRAIPTPQGTDENLS